MNKKFLNTVYVLSLFVMTTVVLQASEKRGQIAASETDLLQLTKTFQSLPSTSALPDSQGKKSKTKNKIFSWVAESVRKFIGMEISYDMKWDTVLAALKKTTNQDLRKPFFNLLKKTACEKEKYYFPLLSYERMLKGERQRPLDTVEDFVLYLQEMSGVTDKDCKDLNYND